MIKFFSIVNVFFFLTFVGCVRADKNANIEKALLGLTTRYSQLSKGKGNQSDYFKLIRSVIIGINGIELQLRSSPDTLDDPQQMILIINPQKEVYAIPLFSNTYHDYWNFEFDSSIKEVKPIKTTFEKELNSCFKTLKLYDTSRVASEVINELFLSLLQCEEVRKYDSAKINELEITNNTLLAEEANDSCDKRIRKNWQAIQNNFKGFVGNSRLFYDGRNKRVYQFNFKNSRGFKNDNRKQKISFTIKTYRQDCIWHFLYL